MSFFAGFTFQNCWFRKRNHALHFLLRRLKAYPVSVLAQYFFLCSCKLILFSALMNVSIQLVSFHSLLQCSGCRPCFAASTHPSSILYAHSSKAVARIKSL